MCWESVVAPTTLPGRKVEMTSRGGPELQADDFGGVAVGRIVAFAVAGFLLTVLAAFDVRPTSGPVGQIALVVAVLVGTHAAVGAFGALVWVHQRHDAWLPLGGWRLGLLAVVGVAIVALVVLFDVWLYDEGLDSPWTFVYGGLAVAAVAVGAVVTYLAASPDGLKERGTTWAVLAVQASAGFGLGLVAALGPVVGMSVLRYSREVVVPEGPMVEMEVRTYTALGDSYSAGEGISPYLTGTRDGENRCHRSPYAYSQQLQFAEPPDTVQFVACSGAVTLDATKGFPVNGTVVPPQIVEPPDNTVDLVTITMGGNDVLFSSIVTHCLLHDDCTNAEFTPPEESERAVVTYPPPAPLGRWAIETADLLAPHLGTLYDKLRTAYPKARIVVLGYPYLFPSGPAKVSLSDCDTVLRMVSETERDRLRELQDRFNDIIYEEAVGAGVDFVSPIAIWDGHEPCGDRGQYTNAVKPIVGSPGTFHPNPRGQRAYATLLACYLAVTERPAAKGERALFDWEEAVTDAAPAPGSAERPVPCDGG
jgi:lysophospholipase L1-like esterase